MTPEDWLRTWTGPDAGVAGGLAQASAAFQRFASDYARCATTPTTTSADWERLALELARALLPPGAPTPGPPVGGVAALFAVAGTLASGIAREFAERLAKVGPPATLRAAFDTWVDAAESAFGRLAITEGFTAAQAAACNELVRLRQRQQGGVDDWMRLAGLPTRGEVDALHDTVRELREALAARDAAPARRPRTRR